MLKMAQHSTKTPFGGPAKGPQGPVQMSTPSESILQWTVALLTNFHALLQICSPHFDGVTNSLDYIAGAILVRKHSLTDSRGVRVRP